MSKHYTNTSVDAKKDLRIEVQKSLKGKNIAINYLNDKDKYTSQRFHQVYKGYDFLGDLCSVRTYIQKRYKIDFRTLEVLLKLMKYKVFTREMFSEIPKNFTLSKWNHFIKLGYLNLVMDASSIEDRLFCLNTKGRNIVISFYEYLSGEKKIPETSRHNPMANNNTKLPFDKRKMEVIKKLNQAEVAEHTRFLFK